MEEREMGIVEVGRLSTRSVLGLGGSRVRGTGERK